MKLTFLGTGTSTGVPQLRCHCDTCLSQDVKDKRLRCSALIETHGKTLLIDCGPDFRQQMLRYHDGNLDALLITHHHYDHVGGTDDLRPYCPKDEKFPVFCNETVAEDFKRRMPYCFMQPSYPGVPHYELNIIKPFQEFKIDDIKVEALPINHYLLEILGFKIGHLVYITDAKHICDDVLKKIAGINTLVINALRQSEHISHLSLEEALAIIEKVNPSVAYLTHVSHDMGKHETVSKLLPSNVKIAYDGLEILIP